MQSWLKRTDVASTDCQVSHDNDQSGNLIMSEDALIQRRTATYLFNLNGGHLEMNVNVGGLKEGKKEVKVMG